MLAVRESRLMGRRRSLIAEPLYEGDDASAAPTPTVLQRATASTNTSASGFAQQVAATADRFYDVLPASKGELEKAERRIKQDEDLIQQLVTQVNALTPVRLSLSLCFQSCGHFAALYFESSLAIFYI